MLATWLAGVRHGPVDLAVPQRGTKRALQEMVTRNAAEDLARHRLRRAADHNSRSRALTELQAALDLPVAPLRIECYDMSHLQGTDYVGSMVVFEDGLAKKSDYRRFKVKTVGRQRRLRGDGGGADAPADRAARGAGRAGRGARRRGGVTGRAGRRRPRTRSAPAGAGGASGGSPTRRSCC